MYTVPSPAMLALVSILLAGGALSLTTLRAMRGDRTTRQLAKSRREAAKARRGIMGVKVPFRMKWAWYAHQIGGVKGMLLAPVMVAFPGAIAGAVLNKPTSTIVWQGGTPREWCTVDMTVKTATNLRAGVFVILDTTDQNIKLAGANALNVIGVLGSRNWTNPAWDPTTAPATNDIIEVHLLGVGAILNVRNGAALNMGDLVASDASGQTAALATDTAAHAAACLGRALITSDGSGGATNILIGGAA